VSRDTILYLEDIQASCKKIIRYIVGVTFDDFNENSIVYDAVIRNLEIIGEAVRNVPDLFRNKYPRAEWRAIGALRSIVAYEYFGIKKEIIWDIITNKIPSLQNQIDIILSEIKD
jgi:uncharacterized protein with HEPN domain